MFFREYTKCNEMIGSSSGEINSI